VLHNIAKARCASRIEFARRVIYILRIRPGWAATPLPDTAGRSTLRSLSQATQTTPNPKCVPCLRFFFVATAFNYCCSASLDALGPCAAKLMGREAYFWQGHVTEITAITNVEKSSCRTPGCCSSELTTAPTLCSLVASSPNLRDSRSRTGCGQTVRKQLAGAVVGRFDALAWLLLEFSLNCEGWCKRIGSARGWALPTYPTAQLLPSILLI
jgi:hypothetical protein